MVDCWLICVPSEGSKQERLTAVKNALLPNGTSPLADVAPFAMPNLKVGTLDSLVTLSDDIVKIDATAESAVNKITDIMKNLLNQDIKQVEATLVVNDKSPQVYLRSFSWNAMKYRMDKSLRELVDSIQQEVIQIETIMKTRLSSYNQVKSSLIGMERKQAGNLAVRSIVDVVKREHFVLDSEYLITLIIAVPKSSWKVWWDKYESLTELVVPRSSQMIAEDDEFGLFTVTVFQKMADDYANKCRELKFTPRDYKYNEKDMETAKKQRAELATLEKEQWGQLLRLTKTNFSEVFACWLHIKAIRVFVEAVLLYGLPPDFMAAVIEPKSKQEKKVRDHLNAMFGTKKDKKEKKMDAEFEEFSQIAGVDKEYYDYVSLPVRFKVT